MRRLVFRQVNAFVTIIVVFYLTATSSKLHYAEFGEGGGDGWERGACRGFPLYNIWIK